jgi:hypothetical protein
MSLIDGAQGMPQPGLILTESEFESLQWLVETEGYARLAEQHPNGHVVVYRDLCDHPLAIIEPIANSVGWTIGEQTLRFLRESTDGESPVASKRASSHEYFTVYRPRQDSLSAWSRELSEREQ